MFDLNGILPQSLLNDKRFFNATLVKEGEKLVKKPLVKWTKEKNLVSFEEAFNKCTTNNSISVGIRLTNDPNLYDHFVVIVDVDDILFLNG